MKNNLNNWRELMNSFELSENTETYEFLIEKYSEKHRFYHNINHIEDCLDKLSETGERNNEIELAIWFHDVVYDTFGKNNELKSAEELKKFLLSRVEDVELIERIYNLIMITKHDQEPRNNSEALIMDVDISILGRSKLEYLNYTKAIRKEYRLIPYFYYKKKRREIMSNFLKRDKLYYTDYFNHLFEKQARINIAEEIKMLK